MSIPRTPVDWPTVIAAAYAAEARPPLTEALLAQIRGELAEALSANPDGEATQDRLERSNEALDAFEIALRSVVGPRVDRLDEEAGIAVMKHRSEADRPLRAFGGQ
jgi:hypothetical protein